MNLEHLERDLTRRLAFARYETDYLHRATRETSLDFFHGRAALLEDSLSEASHFRDATLDEVSILPDAIAVRVHATAANSGAAIAFRRHRWVRREGAFIAAETVIADGRALLEKRFEAAIAAQVKQRFAMAPLGELRAGAGQRAIGQAALLTHEPPAKVRAVCDALHLIWNGHRFDTIETAYAETATWVGPAERAGDRGAMRNWLVGLLADLPDAVWTVDRWSAEGDRIGVLWRLFAHHVRPAFGLEPTGRRLRLLGSTFVQLQGGRIVSEDTQLDEAALHIQLRQVVIAL